MILFDLKCGKGHTFEAWFRDGDAYDDQRAAGAIPCPRCGDAEIEKAPMAPRLNTAKAPLSTAPGEAAAKADRLLREMRRHVEKHCEDVGDRFPEEARKIHYGEVDAHGIYGDANDAEAKALKEEGVPVKRLPWPRRTDS